MTVLCWQVHCHYAIALLLSGVLYPLSPWLALFPLAVSCISPCIGMRRVRSGLTCPKETAVLWVQDQARATTSTCPGTRLKLCSQVKYPEVNEPMSSSLSFLNAVGVGVQTGMQDGDYVSAFQRILLPVAYEVLSTLLKSVTCSCPARLSVIYFFLISIIY